MKTVLDIVDVLAKVALVVVGIVALTSPAVDRWLHADAKLAGSIDTMSADQRMTLDEYRSEALPQKRHNTIIDRPDRTPAELAAIGRSVVFSAQYRGARGRRCPIRYTVADAASGRPIVAGDTLINVTPETNDDTYVWDLWVAEPRKPQNVIVTVELLDDRNFPNGGRVALKSLTLKGV